MGMTSRRILLVRLHGGQLRLQGVVVGSREDAEHHARAWDAYAAVDPAEGLVVSHGLTLAQQTAAQDMVAMPGAVEKARAARFSGEVARALEVLDAALRQYGDAVPGMVRAKARDGLDDLRAAQKLAGEP